MKIPMKLQPGETLADALKRALGGQEPTDAVLKQIRSEQYALAMKQLHDEAEVLSKALPAKRLRIVYDRTDKTVSPGRSLRDVAWATSLIERALIQDNDGLLKIAAVMLNMAVLELNEFFQAAHASDHLVLEAKPQGGFMEELLQGLANPANAAFETFDRAQWPDELWALLTEEERSVVMAEGFSPADTLPESDIPYCPNEPCLGCDLRRKLNGWNDKIKAELSGQVPPGAKVH